MTDPRLAPIPFRTPPVTWHNGRHEVALGVVPIEWVRPAEYNPREMSDDARERLEKGLDHFGIADTLVVAEDGFLLGGHQRLISEQRRGATEVPVFVVFGLSDAERASLNVLLNNPNAQGAWDMGKLTELLSQLDGVGFDATLTGFSEKELERLLADVGGAEAPDLDPGEDRYREQYGVIIVCAGEAEQKLVYDRMQSEGYTCKVVVT